ncbi:MAG: flagellar hook-associated protein FlgL [Bacillus sp. (in: firmicutes)]
MRVTQSMISKNTLNHISNSYQKLSKINDQISTGKKFTKPSDDPVAAMRALAYRTDLNKVEQFKENINEVQSWVDSTGDSLTQLTNVVQRIRELTVQASNGTYEESQRASIAAEVGQLHKQIENIADTQIGGKYIFGGMETDVAPSMTDYTGTAGLIEVEVFSGIKLPLNVSGAEVFPGLVGEDGVITSLFSKLNDVNATEEEIGSFLKELDTQLDNVLAVQSKVGARQNRVELMQDRLSSQEVIASRILSDNEDADLEKVIIELTLQETVHSAALSAGASIMQPTLLDFLR